MSRHKKITLMILCFGAVTAHAQDTLKTDVIDVVKAFKPVLSEAMKIQSNPNPEVPEVKVPVFEYNIPDVRSLDKPTVYTIKPLSMGTALLPKLRNNYTKLGYGNYNTPLAEVYLNTMRNKDLQGGVFYKHLSSNPSGERTFSNNTLYFFGKRFINKGVVSADAYYYRNRVNVYGYEPTLSTNAAIRNLFQTFDLRTSYSNVQKDTSKLTYKLDLKYYNFSDNRDLSENDFNLGGNFNKSLKGNPLSVYTNVNVTSIGSLSRVFVDVNPKYRLNMDRLYIQLGFNSTIYNSSGSTDLYFFPAAEAGYALIKNNLTFYSGITGNVQRHKYRSIALENPFIGPFMLANTENNFEVYGGFRGLLSPQTSFVLQASFATIKNLMFYVTDSPSYQPANTFDPSSAGVFNTRAELNHEFGDKFILGFVMNYYSYDLSFSAPYSMPTFTTQSNIKYNIADKFLIKSEIFTMNKRTALDRTANKEVSMDGFVDLNAGIEYRYNKNTSLFLNANNITNNQYERWYRLPVYGFNILGGITLTF